MKTTAKQPTFTLLVWDEVPERTDFYLIPDADLTEADSASLGMLNNKLANGDDLTQEEQAAWDCALAAICNVADHLPDGHPVGSRWAQRFVSMKLGMDEGNFAEPRLISRIIHTGMLL